MEKVLSRKFNVTLEQDLNSGVIISERWENEQGLLYRPNGSSIIERDPKTGRIVKLLWTNSQGELHREGDKPAHINIDPYSLVITHELYAVNGKEHRQLGGAPSWVDRDASSGKVIFEGWKQDGEFYRENGLPILVEFDPKSGMATRIEYGEGRRYTACEILRDPSTGAFLNGEPDPKYCYEIEPISKPLYFSEMQCSLYQQPFQLKI